MTKLIRLLVAWSILFSAGCDNAEDYVFVNGQNATISAPICVSDTYSTSQNTALNVSAANGVLINDFTNGATLSFQAMSAQGGELPQK